MSVSAIWGYALFADSYTGVVIAASIGAVGSVLGAIVSAFITNSNASKRPGREGQYYGARRSRVVVPFVVLAVVLSVVALYASTRPDATSAAVSPVTVEEASAFVTSYLDRATHEESVDQAWAMNTENHQKQDISRGLPYFRSFWGSWESVTQQGAPPVVSASATQAKLTVCLLYTTPAKVRTSEVTTFTLIRVNGGLFIDDLEQREVTDCP